MAVSRGTSNGPDWKDVSLTMDALEEEWGMPVKLAIYHSGTSRTPELRLVATLHNWKLENGGLSPWASVSKSMRSGDGTDFEAVLLVLLYSLDSAATEKREQETQNTA